MNESTLAQGRHGSIEDLMAPPLEGERERKFFSLVDQMKAVVGKIERQVRSEDECPVWLLKTDFQAIIDLTNQARIVLRG
mgnify:CR=1 FL=1